MESDTNYLVQPKLEVLDELEITYEYEDTKYVIPKVELPSASPHLDHDVNEQNLEMVIPIKTELVCDDFVEVHNEHGSVSEHGVYMGQPVAKIKLELSDTSVDAACASTHVSPVSARLAMNSEQKVQAEETETLQNSIQVIKIENDVSDNQFHTSSITEMNRMTNCVFNLRDAFEIHKKDVPETCDSVSCDSQFNIDTASEDCNYQLLSQIEEVNKRNVSQSLQSEITTLIGKSLFTCNICKKTFKLQSILDKHMNTHNDIYPFHCKFCSFKSKYNGSLKIHMRTHTGEKPYCCKLCDYKSSSNSHLVQHIKTHTGEKPYSCKLCQSKFGHKSHLVQHIKTHTGEKPYSCEYCDYKSARNTHLLLHMKTHTGKKPFSCELCHFQFAEKSRLVQHMITHTGDKPLSCKLCDYKCVKNSELVQHTRTHTGEKPYSCKLCNFKFARKGHLVQHMSTHTGEKPFSCEFCDYRCARKSHLAKHMKTHKVRTSIPV